MLAWKRKMGGHTTNDIYDSAAKARVGFGKKARWMAPLNAMNARTKKKESKEGEGEKVTASINASINLPLG